MIEIPSEKLRAKEETIKERGRIKSSQGFMTESKKSVIQK
jgi:hypothetical protein